jgi:hypothetical protein
VIVKSLNTDTIQKSLTLLSELIAEQGLPPVELLVCGGSALMQLSLAVRTTTKDIDILAFMNAGIITTPAPFPKELQELAHVVQSALNLPPNWLNNGPSQNEGGLFQMGLPHNIEQRLVPIVFGTHLKVHFISRYDQIHFKLWAAADQGGYHIQDLLGLTPTSEEIRAAAIWTMEKDVSEGYRMILKILLNDIGYEDVTESI